MGRGPLAGPVVAAICSLPAKVYFQGLDDSKRLTERVRERLSLEIRDCREARWALGWVDVAEIDRYNIHAASLLAMSLALSNLPELPDHLLIDGKFDLHRQGHCAPIIAREHCSPLIGGDRLSQVIAAASVLAKVARDRYMQERDREYPHYGFARNKGYATQEHLQALENWGASPLHRRSFGPVREAVETRKKFSPEAHRELYRAKG